MAADLPILAEMWANERLVVADQVAAGIAAHADGEDHRRRRGLGTPLWIWDSGAEGTPLTAVPTRPAGWVRVPFPAVLDRWDSESYPAGTATVLVKSVAPGAALSTASTLMILSHSGDEASDDTFTPITLEPGTRLAAFLTAVGTCQVLSVNLEVRLT